MSRIDGLVDGLFRRSSARTIALLVRALGPAHLDVAEDAVQEAMLRALRLWPLKGVPESPEAWLLTVARRAALDLLRRRAVRERHAGVAAEPPDPPHVPEHPAPDDELELLFLCAHPDLSRASRLVLMLKEACGFGTAEIAAALFTTTEAVAQRLVRAKRRLREAADLRAPRHAGDRRERLGLALESLVLLFNEGYAASSGAHRVRPELCSEAIRLTESLLSAPATRTPEVHAALALMRFHGSRLAAREDPSGVPLTLAEQDRSRWDRRWIESGLRHLEQAMAAKRLTKWHVHAGIAACHAVAADEAATEWGLVLDYYDMLRTMQASPVVEVNRAIALGMAEGPDAGLAALAALAEGGPIASYAPLEVARGGLLARAGRPREAAAAYRAALARPMGEADRRFVLRALARLDPAAG